MSSNPTLSVATRAELAKQIGELYPSFVPPASLAGQNAELTEAFEVWMLPADSIIGRGDDLGSLAQNTGRWHVQIKLGTTATAVARAIPLGGGETNWQVRQLMVGPLAADVDAVIRWIDNDSNIYTTYARLLEIPAFQVICFWVFDHEGLNTLVPVSLPQNAVELVKNREYTQVQFFAALRKEHFVVGIR